MIKPAYSISFLFSILLSKPPSYKCNFYYWGEEMGRIRDPDEKSDIAATIQSKKKTSRKIVHTRSIGRWENIIKMHVKK